LHREIGGTVFLSRMARMRCVRPVASAGDPGHNRPNPSKGESDDAKHCPSAIGVAAPPARRVGGHRRRVGAVTRHRARPAKRQSRHAGDRDQQPAARLCARASDPDVIVVDPSFLPLRRNQGAIYRVWTGALWAEGPAWSRQGRYVVFSNVSGNVQYRISGTTAGSRCSPGRPTTATARHSIFRDARFRASILTAASFAGSRTDR